MPSSKRVEISNDAKGLCYNKFKIIASLVGTNTILCCEINVRASTKELDS